MSMTRIRPVTLPSPSPSDGSTVAFGEAIPDHHHVEKLQHALRILRLKQLMERTGLSRSAIFEKLNPRSEAHDAGFPQRLYLNDLSGLDSNSGSGRRRGRAIGFLENEVNAWIAARAASRTSKLEH